MINTVCLSALKFIQRVHLYIYNCIVYLQTNANKKKLTHLVTGHTSDSTKDDMLFAPFAITFKVSQEYCCNQ